jgi:hypothetical protein
LKKKIGKHSRRREKIEGGLAAGLRRRLGYGEAEKSRKKILV